MASKFNREAEAKASKKSEKAKASAKKASGKAKKKGEGEMLTTAVPYHDRSESISVRTRKISNGWLTSTSTQKNGKYSEREVFSPTKPKIDISPRGSAKG